MKTAMSCALAAASLLIVPHASAQHFELGLGVLDEIENRTSQVGTLAWFPRDGDWPIEVMYGYMRGREFRDGFGSPSVNFLSVSLQRQWSHFFLGFGVAVVDDQSEVLSSVGQFLSTGGVRFGDFSVALRHMSNGNLNGRNRGDNLLTLNYSF